MSDGAFKGWVPEAYLDEVCPPPRATPDDWMVVGTDVRLAGFDEHDAATVVIVEGQTVVFHGLTDFDDVRVTWRSWGDYTIHDAIAPGASCFCLGGDPDMFGATIGELIEVYEDCDPVPDVTFGVRSYDWCDGTPFVLRGGTFVTPAAAKAGRH